MKSIKWIAKLFKAGALLSMSAMIAVVSLQVFTRYFMETTPHWTEEAARMLFIYSVAFGTGTGFQNGDFIRLDLISRYLTPIADRWLNIITDVIILLFSFFLITGSIRFIELGTDELSPALRISMGYIFVSLTLIGLAVALFTFAHLWDSIKTKS